MADSVSGGVIRFGVRSSEGFCSGVFRLWANPKASDVYLAACSVAGDFQVSLLSSAKWQIGFTAAHGEGPPSATRRRPAVKASEERIIDRWPRPPETAPGLTEAFAVLVASAAVTLPPAGSESDLADVSWYPKPETERLVEFRVFLSTPAVTIRGWPGRSASATTFIGSRLLANRETVWVVVHESDGQPQRIGRLSPLERGTQQEALARLFGPGPDDPIRGLTYGTTQDGLRCLYEAVSSTRP
jgi:hypothetical protein